MTNLRILRGAGLSVLCVFCTATALAERVTVTINGLEEDMLESARANLELKQYEERDVSAAQARRLFDRGKEQIVRSLEPFGFYNPSVDGRLERPEPGKFHAVYDVKVGEPVIVQQSSIEVAPEATALDPVKQAVQKFEPRHGERLDHATYERSKDQISKALANDGFLGAQLVRHKVSVVRSANTADIDLAWDVGPRYRLGELRFSKTQFPDSFLQKYKLWKDGEYYSADKLLALQQSLVDADYFTSVAVAPDLEHAANGEVPVDVMLIPAKRTLYTANLYFGTDSGPGAKVGVQRRWLNKRGHKLGGEIEYSSRLEEYSVKYQIPKPGPRPRNYIFGVGYRDEETDTSTSRMFRLAATQVADRWKGFTRTVGLQYLNGDFEIADERGQTSLLYADGLLTRKQANDIYFPTSGYSLLYGLRFGFEQVLSDTTFAQLRAEGKWLKKVTADGRVIFRAALGGMIVDDFDALPPELRFFAGGDRSIRGFDYQAIGETNASGGVIGGEYLIAGSAEYEHFFFQNWGAAVFVDAGDAFKSSFDMNVGAGIGLRWKSPIGMVRVDLARPVVTDLDGGWRVHLIIGPDL
ncbi:outer membrane protein assembly factor [Steroidobacter agaridevorans]|uniref:Translocation and assembly module subunit TamA n=1 Tax=Steroidobacter agaridevorans TaxID=2695856 RepID=A0A829YEY1_9GAMM|nr:autotransporter assembly complex family protein [Steroidobacter agaridevorans]GFE81770.1 outer membrane protein assembly factor [Steroidobacter agaridevorans]GFE90515.1 outer membrane protein assembly factor [Steroidobacter agaridevorans]